MARPTYGDEVASALRAAVAHHRQGRLPEAETLYRHVLDLDGAQFDALHLLGVANHQQGRHEAARALIERAIAVNPGDPVALTNLGLVLRKLDRFEDALACHDRALALDPGHVQSLNNRGNVLRDLGRAADALASYERALALKPDYAVALRNRGEVLLGLGRHADALASFDAALRVDAADVEALRGRGHALAALNRPADALESYDCALTLVPGHAGMLNHRGTVLGDLGRHDEALASYERALAADPAHVDALFNRSNALMDLRRFEDAAASFARLVEADPRFPFARGQLLHAKMLCCDWNGLADLATAVTDDVRAGRESAEPFGYQAIATSEEDLMRCAEIFATARFPASVDPLWRGERYRHPKIRVGYVSGEFRQQATSFLIAELIERHDRERFEIVAFDNGFDDGSETRKRLEQAFAGFVDITALADREAAALIHRREIDILVNLNGYFGRGRQGVFAQRPCPVQVNYLGFPGTIGARYIDYIVADARVIPPGHERFYDEKVVRLPDSYQANDSRRRIAERTPTRAEAGLPERGFVFCCFNNNYKITPAVFECWMRLLGRVSGSVLWLFEDNAVASRNLQREAAAWGIAPDRLVFAPRVPPDTHLARHRLADLFLDTLPYNAHTTASDALWAGLPVLTTPGTTFPGRVATSLLEAAGLPELVTADLGAYEALAFELAGSPERLSAIRDRLARRSASCALFDAGRYCRNLEAAYAGMRERSQRGESPAAFDVSPPHFPGRSQA